MRFENFNTTMFRALFGNETYEAVKDLDFTLRITNEEIQSKDFFNVAYTYQELDMLDNPRIYVVLNLSGILQAARIEGRATGTLLERYRNGVLVHEIVHVMQMLNNRLSANSEGIVWCGRKHSKMPKNYHQYLQLPWEKEALVAGFMVAYAISEDVALAHYNERLVSSAPWWRKVYLSVKSLVNKGN